MKVKEILGQFDIYMSNDEKKLIKELRHSRPLNSFSEHDQFTIESLIRKSLVIKIGDTNPRVIANEF